MVHENTIVLETPAGRASLSAWDAGKMCAAITLEQVTNRLHSDEINAKAKRLRKRAKKSKPFVGLDYDTFTGTRDNDMLYEMCMAERNFYTRKLRKGWWSF